MADAWGKIPAGITQGNFMSLGNFDQCLSISQKVKNDDGQYEINGQYCLANVQVKMKTLMNYSISKNNFETIQLKSVDNSMME